MIPSSTFLVTPSLLAQPPPLAGALQPQTPSAGGEPILEREGYTRRAPTVHLVSFPTRVGSRGVMSGLRLHGRDGVQGADVRPIVLLGASYLAAWPLTEIAGHPVLNRGVPGDRTPAYLERFQRDVVDLRPCAVVIWGVDNDVIRAPRGRTAEACWCVERNLEALIRLARAHDIEPILVTDLTLRPPARWYEWAAAVAGWLRGRQSYQSRINGHVLRLNVFARDLAARTGTRLLDLHPLVSARNGMRARRYAKRDGSHLTDAGYRVIDGYVIPRLTAWLGPSASAPIERAAGG
jgi:lysophospholipase L1-like esterase